MRDLLLLSLEIFSTVHALMRHTATLLRLSSQGFNNTYNQDLFTERALEIIENHDVSQPLYIYLAYMNVHAGCSETLGVQAPLSSVAQYAYTELDTYKVRPLFKRRSAWYPCKKLCPFAALAKECVHLLHVVTSTSYVN